MKNKSSELTRLDWVGIRLNQFEFFEEHENCISRWNNVVLDENSGNITPKAQPFDVLINKVFKGFFRDLFKEWSLNAPTNPETGHPLAPYRQLLAQWIVKAWAKFPKELVRKSWEVCGYKSTEDLNNEEETVSAVIANYSQEQLGTMIENIAGDDARMAWIDEVNDRQTVFPK